MIRLTDDRGFLNDEGNAACQTLNAEIAKVLATATNEIHLRSLGCAIMNQVGNQVADAMMKMRQL